MVARRYFTLRALLKQFGATQSQMAMLLNISSTSVFNASQKNYKTPAKARTTLSDLSEWVYEAEQKVAAQRGADGREPQDQDALRYEHARCTLLLEDIRKKLKGLETRYKKYHHAHSLLEAIHIPDSHPDHLIIRRWMEARREQAKKRMIPCNPEKQLHLRLRIAELEGALTYLNTLIVQEPPAAT